MKPNHPVRTIAQIFSTGLLAAGLISGLVSSVGADEPKTAGTNSVNQSTVVAATAKPAPRRVLTGAELYSMHCNRCHPERYPTERTAANWKTIMLHMQVRANIPGKQSRLILQYLQENSGR
jgi:hypothetical protein